VNTIGYRLQVKRQRCKGIVGEVGAVRICDIVVIVHVVVFEQIAINVLRLLRINGSRHFSNFDSLAEEVIHCRFRRPVVKYVFDLLLQI